MWRLIVRKKEELDDTKATVFMASSLGNLIDVIGRFEESAVGRFQYSLEKIGEAQC